MARDDDDFRIRPGKREFGNLRQGHADRLYPRGAGRADGERYLCRTITLRTTSYVGQDMSAGEYTFDGSATNKSSGASRNDTSGAIVEERHRMPSDAQTGGTKRSRGGHRVPS